MDDMKTCVISHYLSPEWQLSAEIKTMDFSMPSSYDSIADPVASGAEELTQTTVVGGAGARKKAAPSGVSAKEGS